MFSAGGGGVDDVLQQSQHHQQQLDEYVPTAVMDTLLRVLQDPLLTGHYQVQLLCNITYNLSNLKYSLCTIAPDVDLTVVAR